MADNLPHILLVDDDQKLLLTLGEILKVRGFEPILAQTGGAALKYIEDREIDVALIDLKLEDMHGLEVLRRIKARSPDCECILLTGNASQDTAIQAIQMGAYGYFQKPFDVAQVLVFVQRAADKRQSILDLRDNAEKFRTVADFTYDWEIWLDTQQQLVYISPACERISGYCPQEFIDDPALMGRIVHPEDYKIWDQHLHLHEGKEPSGIFSEIAFRIIRRDGETRWIEHACRTVHGTDGKYLGRRASNRDITERKQAEEALKKKDEFIEAMLQSSAVATFVINAEHQVIYWNRACEDLTGIKAADLIGSSYHWKAFYDHPRPCVADIIVDNKFDDMGRFYNIHTRSALIPNGLCAEGWYPNLGGKNRYLLFDAAPIYDEHGKLIAAIETLKDITERKQIENELRESEEKYRRLFDRASLGIFQSTPDGKAISVNPAFARMFGYDSIEDALQNIKNVSTDIFVDPNRRAEIIRMIEADPSLKTFENVYRRKDGSSFIGNLNTMPIKDSDGRLIRIEGIIGDITERKRIENELRESEEKYRRLVELSPDLIAIHSAGKICFANQAGLRLVGAEQADQMLGKPILDFVTPGQRAEVAERIQQAYRDGIVLPPLNEKFVRVDGSEVDVSVTSVPTAWQGKPAMQVIARDITEHKLAEEELRRAKEALETALAREKELSHTDFLTSVNNRRHLYEHAEHEFDVAARYQQPLSVMMFDIDHFKDVNDTFGHAVGDQILRSISQIARAELRSVDVIGRYGGEEFIVLLPMTNAKQAHPVAERIRAGVAGLRVPTSKGNASVTLSIGIVEMNHTAPAESVEDVFRRVDIAMYAAKQAGRNAIVIG